MWINSWDRHFKSTNFTIHIFHGERELYWSGIIIKLVYIYLHNYSERLQILNLWKLSRDDT